MTITKEENEILTRVGKGTPGGDLLRRYWHAVAATSSLGNGDTQRVRLLGEDLVLYRTMQGELGIIAEACKHRSCSLYYGIPEPNGIRCAYHGWLYDLTGQCVETPNAPVVSKFAQSIKATTYPVAELGGLVFTYLGPDPVPDLPHWDLYVEEGRIIRQIGIAEVPCNWFQAMENSVDPYHTEWLHGYFYKHLLAKRGDNTSVPETMFASHDKAEWDEFEYGIIKRRKRTNMTEDDDSWKIGHPLVFPTFLKVGIGGRRRAFQIRTPMDDEHILHIWYDVVDVPEEEEFVPQTSIPWVKVEFQDDDGEFLVDGVRGQDIMAWVTQGSIVDRTVENLTFTDRGISMFRKLFFAEVAKVAQAEDPICTFRNGAGTLSIPLPVERHFTNLQSTDTMMRYWRSSGFTADDNDPEVERVLSTFANTPKKV